MEERTNFHVGLDVHKDSISVAAAEPGRAPGRLIGKITRDVAKLLKVLAKIGTSEQQRWHRLSEHRIGFDKWSSAGLASVQSCPRRRACGACDARHDRRGGQLVFTAQAARLIADSVAK